MNNALHTYFCSSAMLDLTLNLLLFAFAQELYPATCANLNSSFYTQERGLVIKVNGYNDKLPVSMVLVDYLNNLYNYLIPGTCRKYSSLFIANK